MSERTELTTSADTTPQWGAAETVKRGWRASPELRRGALGTVLLAFLGTAGRLAVPILVQQAIDTYGKLDAQRTGAAAPALPLSAWWWD